MKRRNETIDLLKTIFIIFVIITHSTWPNEGIHNMIAPILDFAVPGFLFISGYLYTKKYIYIYSKDNGLKVLRNRFIRFFAPFIIAYIIEILLLKLSGYLHISSIELTPQYILKGFFLGGYGPGSYYYFIMIQFIIIIPIMQSIIKEYREKGLLIFFVINLLFEIIKSAILMSESIYRLLIFRYLFIISLGIYFGFGYEFKSIHKYICLFVGGLYIILVDYLKLIIQPFNFWQSTSMIACVFYGVIVSELLNLKIKINSKFIYLIGKSTFDILLVQMIYFKTGIDNVILSMFGGYAYILINVLLCVTLGIVYNFFEVKIVKVLSSKFAD